MPDGDEIDAKEDDGDVDDDDVDDDDDGQPVLSDPGSCHHECCHKQTPP